MASNLTRFDPFGDIARFEPFRNIEDFFRDLRMAPSFRGFENEPRIRLDVSESDHQYIVKADMPGIEKDDIKVEIDGHQVSISAEMKKETKENKGETAVHTERYYGQQYRSFTLPQEVDESKAEARYQDGVLELRLPKKAGGSSKKITIQ